MSTRTNSKGRFTIQSLRILHVSRFLGLAALLAAALAACSSSSPAASQGGGESSAASSAAVESSAPASSSGATADACALATIAEVATAFGFTGGAANASPAADTNYAYCEYTSADGTVTVQTYVSFTAAALMIYDGYKDQSDESVSGVGDEAFWSEDVLYVKKGDAFAGIRLAPSSDEGTVDAHEAAVALGAIIAGNM